jgi:hypothetical protein
MVQMPEVRRITSPNRSDSFPSIGNSSSSIGESDEEAPQRNELAEENERLLLEMEHLRAQVAHLQNKLKQQQQQQHQQKSSNRKPSKHKPGVILELPSTLRQSALEHNTSSPLPCCSKRSKEERSSSTDDDQDTVELNMELELHDSAGGLHHRSSHEPATLSPKIRCMNTSPTTRKTDPMSQDSLSTEDDEDDDDDGEYDDDNLESQDLLGLDVVDTLEEYSEDDHFFRLLTDRAGWLVGLLVLQSMSSFILQRNEAMLQQHLIIIRFLTMLVGAGGNAGNQASVRG